MPFFFRPVLKNKIIILVSLVLVLVAAIYGQRYLLGKKGDDVGDTTEKQVLAQVEKHVRQSLGTAIAGYQAIHWSPPKKSAGGYGTTSFRITLVYKVTKKNGGEVMYSKMFEIDHSGNVLFEIDVEPFKGLLQPS
jgi:hypothetical protein